MKKEINEKVSKAYEECKDWSFNEIRQLRDELEDLEDEKWEQEEKEEWQGWDGENPLDKLLKK